MAIKWCHNAKTGEIFSYKIVGELTDFPRGVLLAYGDYLTTGLENRQEAEQWAKEYGCCEKCHAARSTDKNGNCYFCGSKVTFKKE